MLALFEVFLFFIGFGVLFLLIAKIVFISLPLSEEEKERMKHEEENKDDNLLYENRLSDPTYSFLTGNIFRHDDHDDW